MFFNITMAVVYYQGAYFSLYCEVYLQVDRYHRVTFWHFDIYGPSRCFSGPLIGIPSGEFLWGLQKWGSWMGPYMIFCCKKEKLDTLHSVLSLHLVKGEHSEWMTRLKRPCHFSSLVLHSFANCMPKRVNACYHWKAEKVVLRNSLKQTHEVNRTQFCLSLFVLRLKETVNLLRRGGKPISYDLKMDLCLLVNVSMWQESRETSKGSEVVRVMWSRCLSDLLLCLFLVQRLNRATCSCWVQLCLQ